MDNLKPWSLSILTGKRTPYPSLLRGTLLLSTDLRTTYQIWKSVTSRLGRYLRKNFYRCIKPRPLEKRNDRLDIPLRLSLPSSWTRYDGWSNLWSRHYNYIPLPGFYSVRRGITSKHPYIKTLPVCIIPYLSFVPSFFFFLLFLLLLFFFYLILPTCFPPPSPTSFSSLFFLLLVLIVTINLNQREVLLERMTLSLVSFFWLLFSICFLHWCSLKWVSFVFIKLIDFFSKYHLHKCWELLHSFLPVGVSFFFNTLFWVTVLTFYPPLKLFMCYFLTLYFLYR